MQNNNGTDHGHHGADRRMNSAPGIKNLLKQVAYRLDNVFLTRFPIPGCEFIRSLNTECLQFW